MQKHILFILCFITIAKTAEEFECSLNVQTLCAPDFKIREKYYDEFANWHFNYDKFVDVGPHNHITNRHQVERTNSIFGTGAYFAKDAQMEVSFVPPFEGSDWAVSFVLMFEEIGRQIKTSGSFMILADDYEDPTHLLKIQMDSTEKTILIKSDSEDVLTSTMRLQPALWYRIFVILHDKKIKLYVNGIESGEGSYAHEKKFKKLTILLENNIPPFNIDALKLFTRYIDYWEVIAASQLFQQNIEWVQLNCDNCALEKAKKCPESYHLCSSIELYSFGITTAKNMGWGIANNTMIWSAETSKKKAQGLEALGLCCRNIDYILIN